MRAGILVVLCVLAAALLASSVSARYTPHRAGKQHAASAVAPWDVLLQGLDCASHAVSGQEVAIDTAFPRFSWKLHTEGGARGVAQVAYQYVLESGLDGKILHDSGRVQSSAVLVQHAAESAVLESHKPYNLRVKYWSSTGVESAWAMCSFHTAQLLEEPEQATWNWIGSMDINMNELRREFVVPADVSAAILDMSGIGYSTVWLNGQRVDPSRRLDPGWTTFEKRTLYVSLNALPLLMPGNNAIGVSLGSGWYSPEQYVSGTSEPNYGPPRLAAHLTITFSNGTQSVLLSTDSTWQGRQGANLHDGVYMGSIYDAQYERAGWTTAGFKDPLSLWLNASSMSSPLDSTGIMSLQRHEPIRAGADNLRVQTGGDHSNPAGVVGGDLVKSMGVIIPTSIGATEGRTFDLGQNMAGWCAFEMSAHKGLQIRLRYAEVLRTPGHQTDNGLYTENLRNAASQDVYIFRGAGMETIEPNYTVHGFRYFSIQGAPTDPSNVRCYFIHSATRLIGNITLSNQVMNQIQHNVQWGQLSNAMSLPSDCPQRDERKGWMGDAGLTVDEALFNFDLAMFYENFVHLIEDIQNPDGGVGDTVPLTFGSAPADPNWGTAYPTIVWFLYQHYNDLGVITRHYTGIRAWVECVRAQYKSQGLKNLYYHYGDWVPPPPNGQTDAHLIASYPFLRDVYRLAAMANLTGNQSDYTEYSQLYSSLATEFHTTWYKPSIKGYADGMQTANALALALPGVVPDNLTSTVVASLVADLQSHGHVTTGIVGVAALYPVLSTHGQQDLALKLAQDITYPSYGWMFNNEYENATTMWELWDAPLEGPGMNSRNHHMFSTIGGWFYRYVAGIDLTGESTFNLHPYLPLDATLMPELEVEYLSIMGKIALQYQRSPPELAGDSIRMTMSIPPNSHAHVSFEPLVQAGRLASISEGGVTLWSRAVHGNKVALRAQVDGIQWLEQTDATSPVVTARVASGEYAFDCVWEA